MPPDLPTILVADDNPENIRVLDTILSADGFTVRAARNGEQALTTIEASLPDLILLDVHMPRLDGYEACRQIKARPAWAEIPVIFISALSEVFNKKIAFDLGAVDDITKPFDVQEVLSRVTTQLSLAGLRRHLAESNQALEAAVQVRTAELEQRTAELEQRNAELTVAKRTAEEAVRFKAAFLANMSHEIRTPINSITNFAQMLAEKDLSDDQRVQFCAIVMASAEQLLAIVDDVLDLSALETGQMPLNLGPVSIEDVLAEVCLTFSGEADRKHLDLSIADTEEDPGFVVTDKQRLRQVLGNLVSNAIKFTAHGCVEMSCRVRGEELEFEVRDSGIGIPPELHEAVFPRSLQVEPGLTKEFNGVGLGLAISRELVSLLGGRIGVQSSPGRGSVFQFTIPYRPHRALAGGATRPAVVGAIGATILVAEDDEASFRVVEELLRQESVRIVRAQDGLEAIERGRDAAVSVVLMDVRMPRLNGLEAMVALKKERPNLPIVAVSAFALVEDQQRFREAGFDAVLTKPLRPQALREVLAALVPAGPAPS